MLQNFCLILADTATSSLKTNAVRFPSSQDLLESLDKANIPKSSLCKSVAELNELCAVMWNHGDRLNWYVVYVTSKNGESLALNILNE